MVHAKNDLTIFCVRDSMQEGADNKEFEELWDAKIESLHSMRDDALRMGDIDLMRQVLRRIAGLRGLMAEHKRLFLDTAKHYTDMYEEVYSVVQHAQAGLWS